MLLYNDTEADEAASNFYCLEIVLPSALNITSWSQINQVNRKELLDNLSIYWS